MTVSKQYKLNLSSEKKGFYESKYDVFHLEMNCKIHSENSRIPGGEVSETIEFSAEGRDNFTEPQNHTTFGVRRDLCGSSSPTPLPKQGHLQQAAQDLVQTGLEHLQRRRLHNPSQQPVPVLQVKKFLLISLHLR